MVKWPVTVKQFWVVDNMWSHHVLCLCSHLPAALGIDGAASPFPKLCCMLMWETLDG